MDAPFPLTGLCSLRDGTSLYAASITISRIFFVIGLASAFLFLHHARPLTPLALFLLLLTILLFKAFLDFCYICFIACPRLWSLIVFLSYSWWYLRALL